MSERYESSLSMSSQTLLVSGVILGAAGLATGIAGLVVALTHSSGSGHFTPEQEASLKQWAGVMTVTSDGVLQVPAGIQTDGSVTAKRIDLPHVHLTEQGLEIGDPLVLNEQGLYWFPPTDNPEQALNLELTPLASLILEEKGDIRLSCEENVLVDAPLRLGTYTTAEREALTTVPDGTMVFDTDVQAMYIRINDAWGTINGNVTGTAGQISVTGSNQVGLVNVGSIVPGSYPYATVQVDATGRVVGISAGSPSVTLVEGTAGQILATENNPGEITLSLVSTNITPGTYSWMSGTVDVQGRLTNATSNPIPVTSVSGTAGQISATTNLTGAATLSLADTGVTAGTYAWLSGTVNAKGQLTAASTNSVPVLDVTGTANQITVSGPSNHPVLSLPSGVTDILNSWNLIRPADTPFPQDLQMLQFQSSVNKLVWTQAGNSPAGVSRIIYVDKSGSDTTGNGTLIRPFASLVKALEIALPLSNTANPILIKMASGRFVEDNSQGPIAITSDGICISGDSIRGTVLLPADETKDFISANGVSISMDELRIESPPGSTAKGLVLQGTFGHFLSALYFSGFDVAISVTGVNPVFSTLLLTDSFFVSNNCPLQFNGGSLVANSCTVAGNILETIVPTIRGFELSQSTTQAYITSCFFARCTHGIQCEQDATVYTSSCNFIFNEQNIVVTTQSRVSLLACGFTNMGTGHVGVHVENAGTMVEIAACTFDGRDSSNVIQGLAVRVTDDAMVSVSGGSIRYCVTGIQVGETTDLISTQCLVANVTFINNTATIVQQGTTSLIVILSNLDPTTVTLNDTTNVKMMLANTSTSASFLQIGSGVMTTRLVIMTMDIESNKTLNPSTVYRRDLYGVHDNFGLETINVGAGLYSMAPGPCSSAAITTTLNQQSSLELITDTSVTPGDNTSVRGWRLYKEATTSELKVAFRNSINIGMGTQAETVYWMLDYVNAVMQLDDSWTFRWGTDANASLSRPSSGVLRTPASLEITTLNPNQVVVTGATANLASSTVTAIELATLSGISSSVQTQLNGKLNSTGGTLTGFLLFPSGSAASPSSQYGNSNAGIFSSASAALNFATSGVDRARLDSSGMWTWSSYTTVGVVKVHNVNGDVSSSLLLNADVTDATLTNAKFATISSANNNGYIVVRDGSGSFSATSILLSGAVTLGTQAATKDYVDSQVSNGLVFHDPVVAVAVGSDIPIQGPALVDGVLLANNDRVLLTSQTNPTQNGPWLVNDTAPAAPWSRPTDFPIGGTAGAAYFLVTQGDVWNGSSWVCNTPLAVINDPSPTGDISMAQFSQPNFTTGANVGTGTGNLYRDLTGNTLNFRRLLSGDAFLSITTGTDDVSLMCNGTSLNTPSTLVARDGSGGFSAGTIVGSLTGAASLNLLLTGGTLLGFLAVIAGTVGAASIRFTGSNAGTGLSATVADVVQVQILGVIQLAVSATGLQLPTYGAGVLHTDGSGVVTASSISGSDIADNSIANSKLQTLNTPLLVSNAATTATPLNTPLAIMSRDASGNVIANEITAMTQFVGNLIGAASLCILKAGGEFTGAVIFPIGSFGTPSIQIGPGNNTGFSSASGNLQFSTNSLLRLEISASGVVTITNLGTGVVKSTSGLLTASGITNADVSPGAGIVDTKLDTISTPLKVLNSATSATPANTALAIVSRDSNGAFVVTRIDLTDQLRFTANSSVGTYITLSGTDVLDFVTASSTRMRINASGVLALLAGTYTTSGGVLRVAATTGVVSAGSVVTSDFVAGSLADSALATISTSGKVADSATSANAGNVPSTIVWRNASGDFAANVITASLTGAASLNALKSGDTFSGPMTFPAGAAGTPSIRFTGSLTTGISVSVTDVLEFQTAGSIRATLSATGSWAFLGAAYTAASGVLHATVSTGAITSSLIVGADIASDTIPDSKLQQLTTPLKVANSATSANSANVANSIVARDVNGSFVATNVTATTLVVGASNPCTITNNATASRTCVLPDMGTATTSSEFMMCSTVNGAFVQSFRFTPATIAAATWSPAEIAGGISTWTSGATVSLPTGVNLAAHPSLAPFNYVGATFSCLLQNARASSGVLAIANGVGCTLAFANCNQVPASSSRMLFFRNTGPNTFVVY